MRKCYRLHKGKMKVGPGGLYCPCCNPMGKHPRKSKAAIRRWFRRKHKQELTAEGEA